MTIQEYYLVQSEIATLDGIIMRLPESSIIDRMSFEARKESLEEEIASRGVVPLEVATGADGEPRGGAEMRGQFLGVLPNERSFEFRVEGSGEIITGRVGAAIEDARAINNCLNQPVAIRVHVEGEDASNSPTYVLSGYETEGGREDTRREIDRRSCATGGGTNGQELSESPAERKSECKPTEVLCREGIEDG